MSFRQRNSEILASFRRLPVWVQCWVGLLAVANSLWLFLLDTPTGVLTGVAAIFVLLTNLPIMYVTGGMSKLMSIPHLLAWIPLEVYLIGSLLGNAPMQPAEAFYASGLLIINGISLGFDFRDAWLWLMGDRAIP